MRRRGATLIEIAVGLALVSVAVLMAYGLFRLLARSEQATDSTGMRAILEARLMESLLRDVKSSIRIEPTADPDDYTITRSVLEGDRLQTRLVSWKRTGPRRIVRQEQGGSATEFDFSALLPPSSPPIQFRLLKVSDEQFDPQAR